jgi:hypothetical protein
MKPGLEEIHMVFLGLTVIFLFFVLGIMFLMALAARSGRDDDQDNH